MDCKKLADTILEDVGGADNIISFTHCSTRIRFKLKNEALVDNGHLRDVRGVLGVLTSGGQYQVVLGSRVPNVYKNLEEIAFSDTEETEEEDEKQSLLVSGFKNIWEIILPLLPVLIGIVLLEVLQVFIIMQGIIEEGSYIHKVISTITDTVVYILPFLVAYSVARKLKINVFVALVITGLITRPELSALIIPGYTENRELYNIAYTIIASFAISVLAFITPRENKKREENVIVNNSDISIDKEQKV